MSEFRRKNGPVFKTICDESIINSCTSCVGIIVSSASVWMLCVGCLITGHSRTIVGVEEMTDGSLTLLIFDPGCHQMKKFQTSSDIGSLIHLMRKGVGSLTSRQYQILSVHGLIYDSQEHQATNYVIAVVLWCYVKNYSVSRK